MIIRAATPDDTGAITAIWNHYITHTIATFNAVEKTEDDVRALIGAQPFFIAKDTVAIQGFATYGDFRKGVGYGKTAEHSVFMAQGAQGQGRPLMHAIEAHAKSAGIHSLFAGVTAQNTHAVTFHQKIGYEQVACLKQVGWKFERWHDLILMQKFL